MPPPRARFRVDPKLAALLGEGYRSSEHAIKELIDNAWDADASTVHIALPVAVSGQPIVITDDGTGMTEQEVRHDYLFVASDRSSRKGDRTAERNRVVKGRKGIGKFAGLMAADSMTLETRCRGTCTRLTIRKEDLRPGAGDLETIDLPVHTSPCDPKARGTTITLEGLSQAFDPPSTDKLKPLLILEYGRQDDFVLSVNGEPVGVEDIPGQTFQHEDYFPFGQVRLRFTVSEGKKPLRQSGVAVRVTEKIVGKPTVFGLDEDEEIPPKLLRKVYGELDADGLVNDVTADWGAIIENSSAFAIVSGWAGTHLKRALSVVYANEMQLARARLAQHVQRRLAHLPEHKREFAEQRVERVLAGLWNEKQERIDVVVHVALDAIEYDEHYAVVKAVHDAPTEDVTSFAAALGQFGLADMAAMAEQARRRLAVLDDLDRLIANPATRESDVHVALEHNLWVLGSEFALLASNKTLKRTIEAHTAERYKGDRASDRPDLLLLGAVTGRHVLIEFKRPSTDITRVHEAQATSYRDELVTRFPAGIDVLVIGRGWAEGSDRTFVAPGLRVTSYTAVISRARAELTWLLDQLADSRNTPSAIGPSLSLDVPARV